MTGQNLLHDILARLSRGDAPDSKWPDAKGEYWALCPFHNDGHTGSFSVGERGYKCFACGEAGSLEKLAVKLGVEVLKCCGGGKKTDIFSLTLADYAAAKKLPADFLEGLGLTTCRRHGHDALKIPYYDQDGNEAAVRYRLSLAGDKRFEWVKGSKLLPYGLWRLADAKRSGYVILVEGESDAQTLWLHGLPSLGIPGATAWKADWAKYLDGLATFVWLEPDRGGQGFVHGVGRSVPELKVITPPSGRKDVSECHLLGDDIPQTLQTLRAGARPYSLLQAEKNDKAASEAETKARPLLDSGDILAEFASLCQALGLVGEERNAKLLYLAVASRLLDKPVSVCVKGPSAGGKSFLVETVLRAFPDTAYYALSSMSERALAYSQEPLKHRFLVLYEAAGLASDFGTYLMRTLLSEGRIRYETVEKTADGLVPKLIEREGPTGLLVTTTWTSLHSENETRMFSITVRDDPLQTAAVMFGLADRVNGPGPELPDLASWRALQTWLELAGVREVTIPYAHELAARANPLAVRLRRDFGTVLSLIRTHVILHQKHRLRDAQGRLVATLADYQAVYELVIDILNEGVEATVSQTVRETVDGVAELWEAHNHKPVSVTELATHLRLDKGAASLRCRKAAHLGYIVNLEDRKGRPAQLIPGEPLPHEQAVLPKPEELEEKYLSYPPNNTSTLQHLGCRQVCSV